MKSPRGDFVGARCWSTNLPEPCSWLQLGFQHYYGFRGQIVHWCSHLLGLALIWRQFWADCICPHLFVHHMRLWGSLSQAKSSGILIINKCSINKSKFNACLKDRFKTFRRQLFSFFQQISKLFWSVFTCFKLLMHPDAPCVILLHKVCVTLVNSSGYLAMLK